MNGKRAKRLRKVTGLDFSRYLRPRRLGETDNETKMFKLYTPWTNPPVNKYRWLKQAWVGL